MLDPCPVARRASNAPHDCPRRMQSATCRHRNRSTDPLHTCRRTRHTRADQLTDKQNTRLATLFTSDTHIEAETTSTIEEPVKGRPSRDCSAVTPRPGPLSTRPR
ncbi:hypothetical protein MSAR_17110 [Mycolicibacterium sarraceniae]|uniref:Uncharacterized protein n=1 Tax=Mycolicibacterium sarraceniae TaxID=1534348 RepID=A0A7I7SR73_9MYCO|nr:hypothetical protein MSAR_17110 [Mycolicibacterium sarraceniae]